MDLFASDSVSTSDVNNDNNDNDDDVNNDDDDDDAADRKFFELKARKKGDQDFWVRKLILEDGEKN